MHQERQQWTNFVHISGKDLWITVQVRENVLRETANINMVKNLLAAPTVKQRGGKLEFKSSSKITDCMRCLY